MSDSMRLHSADTVACDQCGEQIPRDHTVMRADHGRLCWFCNNELDGEWDDDYDDYDDWDD